MIYIKPFNESFNGETYLDYLLSEIDESKISFKDIGDNFLFIEYDISSQFLPNLNSNNIRFNDVIILSKYDYDLNFFRVLIVDRLFYYKNNNCVYRNILWEKHPILNGLGNSVGILFDRYKNAQKAVGLPDGFSMIKNFDRQGQIEFFQSAIMDDPIRIWEDDIIYLQYILFKYLGE